MALANVIAYAVVFGLPIWLVAEELIHRAAEKRAAVAASPAVVPAELGRRNTGRVRVHA
ncbi:MAG TPA: hypothetical protein VFE97_11145 [Methylomirabilota bacterium]|nr:hypothetical protein [Methylomirabilota bacterium]